MAEVFNNTAELIQAWPGLDDADRDALLAVVSTRGKWKGYVLANSPASTSAPKRFAAWQAVMMHLAAARVSAWSLMFLEGEAKELYDRLDKLLNDTHLGVAIAVQEPAFRWSLLAHRYDVDLLRARYFQHCQTYALELAGQERLF